MKFLVRLLGISLFIFALIFHSCKKEEVPTLTTSAITNITGTTATSGGSITSEGSGTIVERGICWSKGITPTVADKRTIEGGGAGTFISNMTELDAASTYYVRAYAKNEAGTGYGMAMSFTTLGQVPTASTEPATNISTTSAKLNGKVNANFLSTSVTFEYGTTISYGQTVTPTQNQVTGNTFTNISADIFGLTYGTIYHFRVKTVNSLGTIYGNDQTFTTNQIVLPTLITNSVTAITSSSALSGGSITSDGGGTITARGICWNTSGQPTINDLHTIDGAGLGSFISSINGLTSFKTYYVRAYATNNAGTAYGNQFNFSTLLADNAGNVYKVVAIGSQVWMVENLKTVKYNDGSDIPLVTDNTVWGNLTTPGYCWYNNDISNNNQYGALYNYSAISTGKLCPTGWHIPSDPEWHQLILFLDPNATLTLDESLIAGGKMKETGSIHWISPNVGATNSSGFTGLPAGKRNSDGTFGALGHYGYFWALTDYDVENGYIRDLDRGDSKARRSYSHKLSGISVRCLKD